MDVKSDLRKYYESVNSDKVVSQHRGLNKTCDIGNTGLVMRKVCKWIILTLLWEIDHWVGIQRTEDSRKIKRWLSPVNRNNQFICLFVKFSLHERSSVSSTIQLKAGQLLRRCHWNKMLIVLNWAIIQPARRQILIQSDLSVRNKWRSTLLDSDQNW